MYLDDFTYGRVLFSFDSFSFCNPGSLSSRLIFSLLSVEVCGVYLRYDFRPLFSQVSRRISVGGRCMMGGGLCGVCGYPGSVNLMCVKCGVSTVMCDVCPMSEPGVSDTDYLYNL